MSKMVRMIPTKRRPNGENITVRGRVYTNTWDSVVDVPDFDAAVLGANGWLWVCLVGTTAQRPVSTSQFPNQIYRAMYYYDTTLSKMIIFDESVTFDAFGKFQSVEWNVGVWRDPVTGAAV